MKMSRRARRMERHHKKAKSPALNLVSLMDIFTILVFFLLVNSSNTHQLPSSKDMKLPSSVSQNLPEDTLIIAVTKTDILVRGVSVATLSAVRESTEETIPGLEEELMFLADSNPADLESNPSAGYTVTVMGDEDISYEVMRKVMKTCQQANYTRIAFAANQTVTPSAQEL